MWDAPALSEGDAANWSDAPEKMTDAQKQILKVHLEQLVRETLPHALKSAHLLEK
jgi:hypothetical protein